MKNVLHIVGSMNRGGAESRVMDMFREFDKENYCFHFLFFDTDNCSFKDEMLRLGGVIVVCPSLRKVGLWKYLLFLNNIFRNFKYDVVHVHIGTGGCWALYVAYKNKVPVRIFHARNTYGAKSKGFRRLYDSFSLAMIRKYSNVKFAVSKTAAESYFSSGCTENEQPVIVVPNAINENYFIAKSHRNDDVIRSEFGLDKKIVIGHVGSFRPEKNHSFILDVCSRLMKKNPNIMLMLVGDGALRTAISEKVKQLHLSDKVIFTGVRSDLAELYSVFDIFLFPSISEGLPGSVLEAQACGVKCIISDAIDRSVDIKAGLVDFVSLSNTPEKWCEIIEAYIYGNKSHPDAAYIKERFIKSGYSLEKEIEILLSAYNKAK